MRKLVASVALATAVVAGAALLPAPSANASTISDVFTFKDGSNVVATGSFSYDSSKSGQLTYGDLSAFSITLLSQTFNLAYVDSLANPPANQPYVYFGYNTTLNTFVPAPGGVPGLLGAYGGILAATDGGSGFFFDPLVSQSGPNNDGIFGVYFPPTNGYSNYNFGGFADSFSISETPLPSTWTMLIAGFAGFGFLAYRGTKKSAALAAA